MKNKGIMGNIGPGFISDIILKVRLTISLMKDERVSPWYKLIPALCLVYLVLPLDFLFGPIDDAVVLYMGMEWFIDLCPENLVQEHTAKIKGVPPKKEDEQVIEAEFKQE